MVLLALMMSLMMTLIKRISHVNPLEYFFISRPLFSLQSSLQKIGDDILFLALLHIEGYAIKLIIDPAARENLISDKVVNKLQLKADVHPQPNKLAWLANSNTVLVTQKCKVPFVMGSFNDTVLYDVVGMDACHILLGRPW